MAMTDYFRDCYKVISTSQDDGMGGKKKFEVPSSNMFKGLLVRGGGGEFTVGANRGKENETYNFFCMANVALAKDDRIVYTDVDGTLVYARLTSNEILNTPLSMQTDWKTYTAETYIPKVVK